MLNLLELGKQTLESQVPGVGLPLPYPSLWPQLTEPFTSYSASPYPLMLAPNVLYVGLCLLYVVSSSWLYVALCSFMLSLSWPQDNLKSPYVGSSPYPLMLAPNVLYVGLCLLYVVSSSWLYVALCSFMLSLSWPQDNLKSPYVGSHLLQDAQYAPQRPPRCPNIASKWITKSQMVSNSMCSNTRIIP